MNGDPVRCPVCRSIETNVISAPRLVTADDATPLEFLDRFTRCGRCGEEFYTREQSLASSRAAATVLREHDGLLSPDRIRAIRESYDLTQAEFEKALGLGPKTVVRWESGTVRQGATANSLLLAIEGNRQAFAKVAEANGAEVTAIGVQEAQAVGEVVSRFAGTFTASTSKPRELIQFKKFRKFKPVPANEVAMA